MIKLITSKEIEERYFNIKQNLSTEFKKSLGIEPITLLIDTLNNKYNWIKKNILNCKNITYIGKEFGFIKLTDNYILRYSNSMLMIYSNQLTIPSLIMGTWISSENTNKITDNRFDGPGWGQNYRDHPGAAGIYWLNTCAKNNLRTGFDTAANYRTVSLVGNILRYYGQYSAYIKDYGVNDIFICLKIPYPGGNDSNWSWQNAENDITQFPGNGFVYTLHMILYNLIELGWINKTDITTNFNNKYLYDSDLLIHIKNNPISTYNNGNWQELDLYTKLVNISKNITRDGINKGQKGIDLFLEHQSFSWQNDKSKYTDELGKYAALWLATHAGLIQGFGLGNIFDQYVNRVNSKILAIKKLYNSQFIPFMAAENCPRYQNSCCCDCGDTQANNKWNYNKTIYGDGENKAMQIIYHGTTACGARTYDVNSQSYTNICDNNIINRKDASGTIIWGTSSDINIAIKWANSNIKHTLELLGKSMISSNNITLPEAYYGTTDNQEFKCHAISGPNINRTDLYIASGAIFNSVSDCNTAISNSNKMQAISLVNPNLTNPCCKGNCWPKNVISSANKNTNTDCICIAGNRILYTASSDIYYNVSNYNNKDVYYYDDNYLDTLGWFTNQSGNVKTNPHINNSLYWIWAGFAKTPAEIFNFSHQDGINGPKYGGKNTNQYRKSKTCITPISINNNPSSLTSVL